MAVSFQRVLIGKNVGISIIPLNISGAVITEDAGLALTGRTGECNENLKVISTERSGMDSRITNNLAIKEDFTLEVSAVRYETSNPLTTAWRNGAYAAVVITTATEIRKYWGMMQDLSGPIAAEGSLEKLTLVPIDTGEANPLITAV